MQMNPSLVFACTQKISEPQLGYSENDDCAACVATESALYAWVIDGSTSVADQKSHVGAKLNDVAWYAQALSDALAAHADGALSPKALHALAARAVTRDYQSAVDAALDTIPLYERPSAALTILRLDGLGGELFYLGDCPAFSLSRSGEVARITDQQRTDGEEDLRARVRESQAKQNLSPAAMFKEQLGWLRAGREQQFLARPLDVSVALADADFGGWEKHLDLSQTRAMVLMSDGYERYTAQYALASYAAMIEATVNEGAEMVLGRLRAFEREDFNARGIPRLKVSDDATCLVLSRMDP